MPGGVPARARRRLGARLAAASVAALLALVAGPRARADDAALDATLTTTVGQVTVTIKYPTAEKVWAEQVKKVVDKALPEMIGWGGDPKKNEIEVRFAEGTAKTGGYEAALTPDAIYFRKKIDRGGTVSGAHGHWLLYALARQWTERAARPEWLRAGLAHLMVYQVLKKCPTIYDARTYRDEILVEMQKADDAPLDQWLPAPPGAGAPPEQYVPLPQVARAFGFLYDVNGRIGPNLNLLTIVKALAAGGDPASTKDFIAAVSKETMTAKNLKGEGLFIGWGYVNMAGDAPPPVCDKTDLADSDSDGLLNFEEDILGTDKAKADTDGDGVPDGEEVEDGTDPKVKDAKKAKIKIDGDGKEWMRIKKFQAIDQEGDAKKDGDKVIPGADLKKVNVAFDDKYVYFMIEADTFTNADMTYQLVIDVGDDGVPIDSSDPDEQKKVVWNYYAGFRTNGANPPTTWIGDTHNNKEMQQVEWKNHVRVKVAVKESTAEMRVPLSAFELPPKILLMVYTSSSKVKGADSIPRQVIELEKWKN